MILKQFSLISVLSFSLFISALAGAAAADLAIYSGPTNPDWISQGAATANAEAIMNDPRIKAIFENIENYGDGDEVGYDSALGKWMQAHTGNGQQDVFIAASGTAPSAIYRFPNRDPDGSNIEKFIEDGNVFINVGDYLLFMSYEGGSRSTNNWEAGAANVFDIPELHFWPPQGRGRFMFPTEIGKKYLPSLKAFGSHRPWNLDLFKGTDWEVIPFAVSGDGTPTADPAVAVNKTYGGIIAAMWQTSRPKWDGEDPRGSGVIEFIANWLTEHGRLTTPMGGNDELTTPLSSKTAIVNVFPSPVPSPDPGESLVVNLNITGGENIAGYQATVQFDTTALRYVSSANGSYLPAGAFVVPPIVSGNQVTLAATSVNGGSQGDGTLASLTFEVVTVKPSSLILSEVKLTDVDAGFLSVSSENGEVIGSAQLQRDSVRLIYFRPSDRPRREDINTQMDTLIRDVQSFYATRMQHHQGKTFTFETDARGKAVVHAIDGRNTDVYYQDDTFHRVLREVKQLLDTSKHIYLVAVDISSEFINHSTQTNVCGIGGSEWISWDNKTWLREAGGFAVIPASGRCFNLYLTAHELGHTFNLEHDFRDENDLIGYGSQIRLSPEAAEWLSVHPSFNTPQNQRNQETAFEFFSSSASELKGKITDANGLHQAQLLIPTTTEDPAGGLKLHEGQVLGGKTSITVGFVEPQVKVGQEVTLQVIDVLGNITRQTFPVEEVEPARLAGDVNGDGIVSIEDMSAAVDQLGRRGENTGDVNGDGVVDVADLLLIATAIEQGNAAPSLQAEVIVDLFTAAEVLQWLQFAHRHGLTGAKYQRGFRVLEQLLAILTPTETVLLANYPNPLNPETWIPYHLSGAANVTLRIYAADGRWVRTLALGHQEVGIYQSKGHAAYWDGRNEVGEPVASGVYFYTLTAGDFTATRKMLIRK